MITEYGASGANGQSVIAVIILLLVAFVLPAVILWFDERTYVKEIEDEQKDHTAHGNYV